MAFPAKRTLQDYWNGMRDAAAQIKAAADNASLSAAGPGLNSDAIKRFATYLADQRAIIVEAGAVSGIAAYAQAQLNNNTIDIVAEFNSMNTAIQNTINWIVNNHPKDANGFLLSETFLGDGSGRTSSRLFTSGDLVPFKTVVDALRATIVTV